jgi:putative transposase
LSTTEAAIYAPVPLEFGQYYHIYNHGVARARLFAEERKACYFLRLYAKHVAPVTHTFAYCLLPNHFHFLVQIRDVRDLTGLAASGLKPPSQSFSNLFNAYARAFNRAYDRTGALFQRPFGRIPVSSDAYFTALVVYIHQNPHRHGLTDDFRTWPFSSYGGLVSSLPTRLAWKQVLAWFGGAGSLVDAHGTGADKSRIEPLIGADWG